MTLLLLLMLQGTRHVEFSNVPVSIEVPVSTPTEHRATVVTFPERSLEALVAGWSDRDLSVERRGANLFIKLLRPAEGDLHVLGSSGRLYRLSLHAAKGTYDGHVLIRSSERGKRRFSAAIQLIRAMRRNRKPAEGTVLGANQSVHVAPSFDATVIRVYERDPYRGFVVRLRNTSDHPRRIEPSRFVGRDLVLIGAKEYMVGPGKQTYLYLVLWKG